MTKSLDTARLIADWGLEILEDHYSTSLMKQFTRPCLQSSSAQNQSPVLNSSCENKLNDSKPNRKPSQDTSAYTPLVTHASPPHLKPQLSELKVDLASLFMKISKTNRRIVNKNLRVAQLGNR